MNPTVLLSGALAMASPALASPDQADEPAGLQTAFGPNGHAIVIGSNRPGPGQQPLDWAVADAERLASVFTELGGLSEDRVTVLTDPDLYDVLAALDTTQDLLEAHEEAEERSGLLFYYSGHARASGLDLGDEELSLEALRERLDAMPATVRVVVLDACQSGAVSEVKGIEPVASFSSASVSGLQAEGTAIIASSTGTELSQESPELQGSFFTHHLIVGLRGAADRNLDGTVTLDEAYGYAYDRTLVSTASTSVGRQHPTLQTDLKGRGGVALTRPGVGSARLRFTEDQRGAFMLVHQPSGTVAAEVDKAEGDTLVLALPAGDYDLLWRKDGYSWQCSQTVAWGRTQTLAPQDCTEVLAADTTAKGESGSGLVERVGLEAGAGLLFSRGEDAYLGRLQDFGYDGGSSLDLVGNLQAAVSLHRNLGVVLSYGDLESSHYDRLIDSNDGANAETDFSWRSGRVGLSARAQAPLFDTWLVPYAQAGAGLGWVRTEFSEETGDLYVERFYGLLLAGAAGLQFMPALPGPTGFRQLGIYAQVELINAPVLDNLLGDTRDVGGTAVTAGFRVAL